MIAYEWVSVLVYSSEDTIMEENSNNESLPPLSTDDQGVKRCIFCGTTLDPSATTCKNCGFDPSSWSPAEAEDKGRKPLAPFTIFLSIVGLILFGICIYKFLVVK